MIFIILSYLSPPQDIFVINKYICLKVLQLVPELQKAACLGRRLSSLNYLLAGFIQTNFRFPYRK